MSDKHCHDHKEERLDEAVFSLANAMREYSERRTHEFEWLRAHIQFATKRDLELMEGRIMSAISDYAGRVDAKFAEVGTSVDEIVASQIGIAADVAGLKEIIAKLQTNPGPISTEDQALLDKAESQINALASKTAAASAALRELDAATENAPPAPPAA